MEKILAGQTQNIGGRAFSKLWCEYFHLVQDFPEVFQYMTEQLGLTDYRIYITMAKWSELYFRDFLKATLVFK